MAAPRPVMLVFWIPPNNMPATAKLSPRHRPQAVSAARQLELCRRFKVTPKKLRRRLEYFHIGARDMEAMA
ncbi:MAG: hypothetical protein RL477_502, partial [Pseudomonadota bacterium]